MKNLILFFIVALTVFSSCKKDAQDVTPVYRNEIPADESLPEVEMPHTIITITNASHHDDAFIEKVFTGADAEIGGKFPVGRNSSTKTISTNLGIQTLYVNVQKTGINKSISVVDGKGVQHCKNITGTGYETLTFEDVVIEENKPLTVTYNLTTCINLPEPIED